MEIKFRDLEPADIEVRVQSCKQNGCALLLYKDARCDMRLLDEAVGADRWQKRYAIVGNSLFCEVGIRTDDGWVWKQDCGVKSNTQPEKGEASDAFKRACFNWGIGRELYTAPFIWVSSANCQIRPNNKDGFQCFDRFSVSKINIENHVITDLEIINCKTGKTCYRMNTKVEPADKKTEPAANKLKESKSRLWSVLNRYAELHNRDPKELSDGIKKRPNYEESEDFFNAVAAEFEADLQ